MEIQQMKTFKSISITGSEDANDGELDNDILADTGTARGKASSMLVAALHDTAQLVSLLFQPGKGIAVYVERGEDPDTTTVTIIGIEQVPDGV
jgi:hypothetical protein